MVAAARCEVEPSAAYSADKEAVVDGELDDAVEGLLPGFKEHLQLKIGMDLKRQIKHKAMLTFKSTCPQGRKFRFTFSACTTVLGNPSSRNPLAHRGESRFSLTILITRSSST